MPKLFRSTRGMLCFVAIVALWLGVFQRPIREFFGELELLDAASCLAAPFDDLLWLLGLPLVSLPKHETFPLVCFVTIGICLSAAAHFVFLFALGMATRVVYRVGCGERLAVIKDDLTELAAVAARMFW